ncbi:undecaprenyl/decaprenyl-phosphate alpha-N-acetylglucosaminyl 1-phosphate transferase [bacterium]|nr:undecaprenyl/decaprenyl-phosphate alpha-N-acetylglucosaminyl 1-phosphate transferase [bacterium]
MEYLVLFLVSLLVSLLLTPLVRKIAIKREFVDRPGDVLKIHKEPIPLLGGVAIFISLVAGLITASFLLESFKFTGIISMIVAASIVFFMGLWDDFKEVKPVYRFIAQISAGIILALSGYKIGFVNYPGISGVLVVFYVLGSINSINLLDGIDGLAAGVTIIIGLGFLAAFIMQANVFGIVVSLIFIGAVWGFLPYNFPKPFIFMGDNGSTLLGFILAFLAINIAQSSEFSWFIASVVIMGVPIIDTAVAIARRIIKKRPIFQGDRSHIYDWLMDKGLGSKETVFIFCIAGFGFVVIGLMLGI